MPCRDWPEGPVHTVYEDTPATKAKVKTLEAMLCAVLTASKNIGLDHDLQLIKRINERESGVTKKELFDWWAAHQEKDRARRRAEQAAELKRQVKLQALAKLTPEERKALGL